MRIRIRKCGAFTVISNAAQKTDEPFTHTCVQVTFQISLKNVLHHIFFKERRTAEDKGKVRKRY